ncbi:MAG: leucine-rich repeat domain-containing protein [Kiritimatiellaeota bacterium]|nr:leucine-rich repeat domain-containing protein [Kiritimatiellota bacterium]
MAEGLQDYGTTGLRLSGRGDAGTWGQRLLKSRCPVVPCPVVPKAAAAVPSSPRPPTTPLSTLHSPHSSFHTPLSTLHSQHSPHRPLVPILLAVVLATHVASAEPDWFFETTARTFVTNSAGWRFAATANAGAGTLNVGVCSRAPDVAGVLDFSGGVSDEVNGTGNTFDIVAINGSVLGSASSAYIPKASGLVLPSTLTNLAANAFNACTNMTGSLVLPDGVVSIGNYAFQNCRFTGALVLPDSVTSIGNSAFSGCAFGGSLVIPDSVTSIGNYAFSGCPFGGSLVIGDGVTSIGYSAFNGNTFSGSVTFGAGLVDFGNYIFCNTTFDVRTLTFPDTAKSIGNAFNLSGNANLHATFVNTSLVLGDGVTNIAAYAFHTTGLTGTLTLGTNLHAIGDYAFRDCKITGGLAVPDSVRTVGSYAFSGGGYTGTLTFGTNLLAIGNNAFQNCKFTGDLVLPDSVTSIGNNAFDGCAFNGKLHIGSTATCAIGTYAFQNSPFGGSLLIGDGVTSIGTRAFNGNTFSGSVTFGAGLVNFNNTIFCNTAFDIPLLVIPDTVKSIGDAFSSGSTSSYRATFNGATLFLGDGVTNVAASAFRYCTGLERISSPSTDIAIGNYAFQATSLRGVYYRGGYPKSVGATLYYGSSACTSYVTRASVADWEWFTGLDILGGAATWQAKPIRVADADDLPGILALDPMGGYGGATTARLGGDGQLPPGLAAPRRDNMIFDGYWDAPQGSTMYLAPDMTPCAAWPDPNGGKLYARWTDLEDEDFQSICIEAIEVLEDGDVALFWNRDRVKFTYTKEPYTVVVQGAEDLAGWNVLEEGGDYTLDTAPNPRRLHKARVTPPAGATRGFFKAWAQRDE